MTLSLLNACISFHSVQVSAALEVRRHQLHAIEVGVLWRKLKRKQLLAAAVRAVEKYPPCYYETSDKLLRLTSECISPFKMAPFLSPSENYMAKRVRSRLQCAFMQMHARAAVALSWPGKIEAYKNELLLSHKTQFFHWRSSLSPYNENTLQPRVSFYDRERGRVNASKE